MGMFRLFGRFTALVFGLIASAIALIIILAWGAIHAAVAAFGTSAVPESSRVGWGLLLVGVGVLASILALFIDRIATLLFLVAGIGLFWVISGWAIIPLIFFLLAAFFAWVDRSRAASAS